MMSQELQPNGVARSAWFTLWVMAAGLFLSVMSTTVVSVALPSIGRDLRASSTDLEWVVDAYVIVYASLLVAGGVLGDRYGRKQLFVLGVAIFGVGAFISGLAPSVGVLLVGRVLQGLGPALLVPVSMTILRATFEDEKQRAMAIGLWSTAAGVALAFGPPLGGVLVDGLGWRWVFLFNVPLALIIALVAQRFVRRLPQVASDERFDWAGASLVTFAVATLAFATIEGQDFGWASPFVVATFIVGALALTAFVLVEHRQAAPLIDVSLFTRPAFAAANISAFLVFFAYVGGIVYFSAYFQQVQGHSAIRAGLDVATIGIATAIAATLSGRLIGRVGERWPLVAGLTISAAATLGLAGLERNTPLLWFVWLFALLGAGTGLSGTPTSTIAMSAVDVAHAGMASAIVNTLRQVGQVFGVAVLGALVYAHVPGGHHSVQLGPSEASAFVAGLRHALWVSGIALFTAAALTAVLLWRPARVVSRSAGC
jgi:DHA2 family methylenomycin A resistance protein-like MFS transporter